MSESINSVVAPRRLGVAGGLELDDATGAFLCELGQQLAATNVTLVTGGVKHRARCSEQICADWAIVQGMIAGLTSMTSEPPNLGDRKKGRIETVLPDRDYTEVETFKAGTIRRLSGLSIAAARMAFVRSCDVLLTIAGGDGTKSAIDAALALERPVLPLPFAGGSSRDRWDEWHESIKQRFAFLPQESASFRSLERMPDSAEQQTEWIDVVLQILKRALQRKCFIIMPFNKRLTPIHKAIAVACRASDLQPLRADQVRPPGNAIQDLRTALGSCDSAIAEITSDKGTWNPNVMYELGWAYAIGKPVILIRNEQDAKTALPFDILGERILYYRPNNLTQLTNDLQRSLQRGHG